MRAGKGGGHAYSLDQISDSVSHSGNEIGILSIGIRESQNFQDSPYYFGNIYFNGVNFFNAARKIRHRVDSFSPDVIHCFDYNCYNVFKSLLLNKKYKFVLNKCGGPNQSTYPIAEQVVLFSRENQNWFKGQTKYNKTIFHLIPNRVKKVELISNVEIEKPQATFCFVRIIRIGKTYKGSILSSIDLIDLLNKRGFNVQLYVVGVIEDQDIYKDIVEYSKEKPVIFITEDRFTKGASKMLYLADAVIATGRGVMEASSLGIPVLSVSKNCKYPVLITKDNFNDFFEINFSGRLNYGEENMVISDLERLIIDKEFYNICGQSMQEFFTLLFDVDRAKERYLDVYKDALASSYRVPFYFDCLNKLRTFRSFFIYSKKYR